MDSASKTCCILNNVCFFLEIIRSPESTVVFTDGVATFMCDAVNSSDINWTFNGSLSYQLSTEINETAVFVFLGDVGQSNLTFQGRAEYNTTVVQCIALLARGGTVRSPNATLLIQGMYVIYCDCATCKQFVLQRMCIFNNIIIINIM